MPAGTVRPPAAGGGGVGRWVGRGHGPSVMSAGRSLSGVYRPPSAGGGLPVAGGATVGDRRSVVPQLRVRAVSCAPAPGQDGQGGMPMTTASVLQLLLLLVLLSRSSSTNLLAAVPEEQTIEGRLLSRCYSCWRCCYLWPGTHWAKRKRNVGT